MRHSQEVVNSHLISVMQQINSDVAKINVVLLHGWLSQKEVWRTFMSNVNTEDINLYALDLPGFGATKAFEFAASIHNYADLVERWIEAKNLPNVVLVGHSFGGRLSVVLGSRKPKWLKQIVLVNSAWKRDDSQFNQAVKRISGKVSFVFKPDWMQGFRKQIYDLLGAGDYLQKQELRETFLRVIDEDLKSFVVQIDLPTLIIWGDRDRTTKLNLGKQLHELIPSSRLIILNGAGHFSFLDRPVEFEKEVLNFLKYELVS